MKGNVLVTGGLGFIGSHTVVELVNAGYAPVIIDNLSNSKLSVLSQLEVLTKQKLAFYKNDFQNKAALKKIIKNEQPVSVIHFAAFKQVGESVQQPLKYYRNNVAGLVDLLEVLEGTAVNNFVFSSSCTVYGEPDVLPVTEEAQFKPAESPYGASKQMCETILKDASVVINNLRSIALRYFNPIGAHPSGLIGELPIGTPANLVPFITQSAAGLRPALTVYGNDYPTADGTCLRDYIHVVDLAKAHVAALGFLDKQAAASFAACNIGTGKPSSVLEVIKTFEDVSGQKLNYKIGPRRAGDIIQSYADPTLSKKLLGWQAQKTLTDALGDAWHWQKSL